MAEEQEQVAEAQPEEEQSSEISFDVVGAGFIDGYPGHYANCRAVFDRDTRQLLRIESLTALPEPAPVEEAQPEEQAPAEQASPVNDAENIPIPFQSQGG